MAIILPKTHATSWLGPLFFLAGPVRGGGDWQAAAYKELKDAMGEKFTAAIPTRYEADHPLMSEALTADPTAPLFERQMAWERHYLSLAGLHSKGAAGCLMFWLAKESDENPHPGPEPYAMDSRREMGEWYTRLEILGRSEVRLVVGAHPGFHGLDQIRRCLNESYGGEFPVYGSLFDTTRAAIVKAREL